MVIFYHTDDDGRCAGYWAGKLNRRETGIQDHVKQYIPINYGDEIPFDQIANDELVYIVDFSFPTDDVDTLLSITNNVVWIDHHISAIKKYKDYPHEIDGLRMDGVAGCLLTYFYLKCMVDQNGNQVEELPDIVSATLASCKPDNAQKTLISVLDNLGDIVPAATLMIADWDMWKFEHDNTKAFHMGLSTFEHEPVNFIWDMIQYRNTRAYENTAKIISEGKTIIEYRETWMRDYCESLGFDAVFIDPKVGKYRCFAVNIAKISSDDFFVPESKKDLYDIFVGFSYDGDKFVYSLRAAHDDVDVSKISEHFGGGGHKAASGFTSKDLVLMKMY